MRPRLHLAVRHFAPSEITAQAPVTGQHSAYYNYTAASYLIATVQHKKSTTVKMTQTRAWETNLDRLKTITCAIPGLNVQIRTHC